MWQGRSNLVIGIFSNITKHLIERTKDSLLHLQVESKIEI